VEDNINNNHQPWERKGTLPYTLVCTVKSRPRASSTPHNQERKGRKKKKKLVVALTGLPSYLCSLCAICQSVQARGWYPPHHTSSREA
jgi:hypothetical protein